MYKPQHACTGGASCVSVYMYLSVTGNVVYFDAHIKVYTCTCVCGSIVYAFLGFELVYFRSKVMP